MLLWPEINKNIFPDIFFCMEILVTITPVGLKCLHIILDMYMEGTVSQIVYMGSSLYFMKCRKFPVFVHKI